MSTAAAVRQMLAAGLTLDQVLIALEAIEANAGPPRDKRQERNARYYEKRKAEREGQASEKRLKPSEKRLKPSYTGDGASEKRLKASETGAEASEKRLKSVLNRLDASESVLKRLKTSENAVPPKDPLPNPVPLESNQTPPYSPPNPPDPEIRSVDIKSEFDRFWWPRYPHKVGRADAAKKFEIARRKVSLAELMAGLERYIAAKPVERAWCNPSTWLHQERWADEPDHTTQLAAAGHHGRGSRVDTLAAILRERRAERAQRGGDAAGGNQASGPGADAGDGGSPGGNLRRSEAGGAGGGGLVHVGVPAWGTWLEPTRHAGSAESLRHCAGGVPDLGGGGGLPPLAPGADVGRILDLCADPAAAPARH